MRPFTLTAPKTGISRLRIKGGARPDALYDLINGQFNAAREIVPRPGSLLKETLSSSLTHGLAYYKGLYHVFSDQWVELGSATTVLHVLPHPDTGEPGAPTMVAIHKAEPFLGYLFVIAEYSNGDVYYFWLTEGEDGGQPWEANTVYDVSEMVRPTVPTGYFYRATRLGGPGVIWEAGAARAVNDVVEPTKFNGYEYIVIDAVGTDPRSGTTEPTWVMQEGALVYEDVDGSAPTNPQQDTDPDVPPEVDDRYNRDGTGVQQ